MDLVGQAFRMGLMGWLVSVPLYLVPHLGRLPAWRRGLLDSLGWDRLKASSLTYLRDDTGY